MTQEKLEHGGKHIARVLKEEGVEYQFGVIGGHLYPIAAGLGQAGIKMVHCRHEQCGGYAADGYARAGGRLGVCFGTAGPGMANTVSAIAHAFYSSSPVVALYAQHQTWENGGDALQEGYAEKVVTPFTKWTKRVTSPQMISHYTKKACRDAMAYPPGPVALEFPLDIQSAKTPLSHQMRFVANAFQKPAPEPGDPASVEKAVKILLEAERPIITGGEGIYWNQAGAELREFAEFMQIPVITRRIARGCVPEDHPLAFGGRARGRILREADVAVTIGLKLGYLEGYGAWTVNLKLIQINQTMAEIETSAPSELVIIANPKAVLKQMLECARDLVKESPKREKWLKRVDEIKDREKKRMADAAEETKNNKPIHPTWVAKNCLDVLDPSGVIVFDAFTGSAFMTERITARFGGTILDSGPWAGVGHGVGMGIGAQLAKLGKQVLVIMGDGGIGLGGFDVETAARCELPVVYVIHNNCGWISSTGPVYRPLIPTVGVQDERNPFSILPTRYDEVFKPFGCHTERVEDPAELKPALERAFNSGKTAVVDVVVDPTVAIPFGPIVPVHMEQSPFLSWMEPEEIVEPFRSMYFPKEK